MNIEEISKFAIVGYSQHSDIELLDIGEGYAVGRIVIEKRHLNPSGAVHGGVTFCLADVIGGIACYTAGSLPVTVNSNVSYLRPMLGTKEITARAEVIKKGKNVLFVEANIYDDTGKETVRLTATYMDMTERAK